MLLLASLLAACDDGPAIDGGKPQLIHESLENSLVGVSTVHYFEVSAENLTHPVELKAYFRWRCAEGYIAPQCTIFAWPAGSAPRDSHMAVWGRAGPSVDYFYGKGSHKEEFLLNPGTADARNY